MEWIQTVVEEQHFPFYEFMWVCMLLLWWSVIVRLKNIIEYLVEDRKILFEILDEIEEK